MNKLVDDIMEIPIVFQYLGSWSRHKNEIILYDFPMKSIKFLGNSINEITNKFKLLALFSDDDYSNIKILNIGL